ncbi:hypothetical protein L7F22_028466 [Adiantum nelumboides]|nr:hypothetical protein [Adiantum nelumboides]
MMAVKNATSGREMGNGKTDEAKEEGDDNSSGVGNEDGAGGEGAEWDCIGNLEGHDSECKAVAFSHTGSVLASCSRDKSVWVWEGEEARRVAREVFVSVLLTYSRCSLSSPRSPGGGRV